MLQQVSYQTIGTSKERPRLWIEGVKLNAAGFSRDAHYSLSIEEGVMTLALDPDGTRKVSGKTRNGRDIPVLDIVLRELEGVFDAGTRVRVLFTSGKIRVSLHHEEQARLSRETRFSENLAAGTLSEASMFTGGGISTHAIHSAVEDFGLKSNLAWVVDAELKYLQVGYANNYAITDETTALIGRAEEIEPQFFRKVDILSFSMPCSGFSRAGRSKHGLDPEAHEGAAALFGTLTAIRSANPAVLISENVVEAKNSPAYTLLKTELERLGYAIFERTMSSEDTGTFENRPRYWFVALSSGLAEGFDFSLIHAGAHAEPRTLSSLLDADIPESAWGEHLYLQEKAKRDAAAGKGFTEQLLRGEETSCGTIGKGYQKNRSTEPKVLREDGLRRLLTPAEHARAKSAPPALVASAFPTIAHEILGQSVDWRQAWLAAASVISHLKRQLVPELVSPRAARPKRAVPARSPEPKAPATAQLSLI